MIRRKLNDIIILTGYNNHNRRFQPTEKKDPSGEHEGSTNIVSRRRKILTEFSRSELLNSKIKVIKTRGITYDKSWFGLRCP